MIESQEKSREENILEMGGGLALLHILNKANIMHYRKSGITRTQTVENFYNNHPEFEYNPTVLTTKQGTKVSAMYLSRLLLSEEINNIEKAMKVLELCKEDERVKEFFRLKEKLIDSKEVMRI